MRAIDRAKQRKRSNSGHVVAIGLLCLAVLAYAWSMFDRGSASVRARTAAEMERVEQVSVWPPSRRGR